MKSSVVPALALIAVITLSAPGADARPAQPRETPITRSEPGIATRLARALRRLLESFNSVTVEEGLPTIPQPEPQPAS